MNILPDELIDDLQINNLKIIQKKTGFKFGTDAVLLSDFAKDIPAKKALDLCSGTGIIPLLLSAKTDISHFDAIEIQPEIADMAKRSVELNNLCKRICVLCGDLCDSVSIYGKRKFDLITVNPPYIRTGSGVLNQNDSKIISRHEVACNLEDIVRVSSQLISLTGRLVMVHRPSRLCDVLSLMREYKIEPKRIRFVYKTKSQSPVLFLLEGLYNAKSDVNILPPLYLYNDDLSESEELIRIYQRSGI